MVSKHERNADSTVRRQETVAACSSIAAVILRFHPHKVNLSDSYERIGGLSQSQIEP